jgi:L-arabinose isomerase
LNAGVAPSPSDRAAAIAKFGAAMNASDTGARAGALRRVAENSTLRQQEFNEAFVFNPALEMSDLDHALNTLLVTFQLGVYNQ